MTKGLILYFALCHHRSRQQKSMAPPTHPYDIDLIFKRNKHPFCNEHTQMSCRKFEKQKGAGNKTALVQKNNRIICKPSAPHKINIIEENNRSLGHDGIYCAEPHRSDNSMWGPQTRFYCGLTNSPADEVYCG